MRYLALACDFDGTLAMAGRVEPDVLEALSQLKASGRRLVLVTGRECIDLLRVFPELPLFDLAVVENGAILYEPATGTTHPLADPVPDAFVDQLKRSGVSPLSIGRVIVSTRQPQEGKVLRAIKQLGLELQLVFNKGAVMVLPSGTNKASGLQAALRLLRVSPRNTVGVGDAENDHAFLNSCECAVAVAGALPLVKERADVTLNADNGKGVIELCRNLHQDDLRTLGRSIARHSILLGSAKDGNEVHIPAHGSNILVLGDSGSGKSTLVAGVISRIAQAGYQCCIIDPEGDYETFLDAVVFGDNKHAPNTDGIVQLLQQTSQHAVVNLLSIKLADRPRFFEAILPALISARNRSGSPHWLIIDEAHHLLPVEKPAFSLPAELCNMLFVTLRPEHVASQVLRHADIVIICGQPPDAQLHAFAHLTGASIESLTVSYKPGEAIVWRKGQAKPDVFTPVVGQAKGRRHQRKYAQGELGADRSFYFRGPAGTLNLRAQNLTLFAQLAEGIDEETWLYHLRRHDYSDWFREQIKDDRLAGESKAIESDSSIGAAESRARIMSLIQEQYTLG